MITKCLIMLPFCAGALRLDKDGSLQGRYFVLDSSIFSVFINLIFIDKQSTGDPVKFYL